MTHTRPHHGNEADLALRPRDHPHGWDDMGLTTIHRACEAMSRGIDLLPVHKQERRQQHFALGAVWLLVLGVGALVVHWLWRHYG